ncbi:hypothetical protein OH77DRAFT_1422506 [Trametes cingulata]|nr:hypothetical protein OH77DRAFT_1422506 [Trametes cingulata]
MSPPSARSKSGTPRPYASSRMHDVRRCPTFPRIHRPPPEHLPTSSSRPSLCNLVAARAPDTTSSHPPSPPRTVQTSEAIP